jgi:hypothetical protein
MAKKSVDPLKAKQKKQKIVAAVLGVAFLGLIAFQAPRVLKQLHGSGPPPSVSHGANTTATTPSGTPTLAAPTLGSDTQTPAASTPSTSSLATSPAAPASLQDGQLASFSRFASKDPFAQQISDGSSGSAGSSSSPSGSSTGSKPSASTPGRSSGRAPTPGSAVISVNGTLYSVAVGTDFPQKSSTDPSVVPLFRLVSLTAHTAKVAIVGGSYANGAPTVTLSENKPLTLMNTADGTRYRLILKPVGTSVATTPAPTSTTSTTVTVPPPGTP